MYGGPSYAVGKSAPGSAALAKQGRVPESHQDGVYTDFTRPIWFQILPFGRGFNPGKMAASSHIHVRWTPYKDNWSCPPALNLIPYDSVFPYMFLVLLELHTSVLEPKFDCLQASESVCRPFKRMSVFQPPLSY